MFISNIYVGLPEGKPNRTIHEVPLVSPHEPLGEAQEALLQ
jgi:hypothetical protein